MAVENSAGQGGGHRKKDRRLWARPSEAGHIAPVSKPLITCYGIRPVTCQKKMGPPRLVAVSGRRQDVIRRDFT